MKDLWVSIRSLLKQPGFTVIAVLTLALGIGATSAVFSLIQGVLLTPPPYVKPERLVLVSTARSDGQEVGNIRGWAAEQWIDWQQNSNSFKGIAAYLYMGNRKVSVPPHLKARLSRIHCLTYHEMQRLLAVISDLRDHAIFLIAYRHGLRASEIVKLKTPDVDFSAPQLAIRRLSRGPSHQHPLQTDEVTALRQYLRSRKDKCVALFLGSRGKAISRRGLDWLMKTYGDLASLPSAKRHFHVLKHSVAVHMIGAGVAIEIVHRWLGHTAMKNTAHYVYLASPPSDDKAAVALLGVLPI